MFVNFFIDRPIFASVLAIVIVVAGAVAIPFLPIAMFPEITPPQVVVTATYPGASAEVVEQTVATPIEQQVNGVEDMIYMSSRSGSDGTMTLTVTFKVGADLDIAAVNVQNRVSIAQAKLPADVTRQGLTITKQSPDLVEIVALISPDGSRDELFLANYATLQVVDVLARVPGVGQVTVFNGRDYGMRLWLNPDRLAGLGLTAGDVADAVREQNLQAAAGQIGQPPSLPGQQFQYTVTTRGRLSTPAEFEDIILRTRSDGSVLRVRDVARVELGAQSYGAFGRVGGSPAALIGIFQLPGANALDVSKGVQAAVARLAPSFPSGVTHTRPYNTTEFVRVSIEEVVLTLLIAIGLVVLTVYVFLQDWRATLIPTMTIPVSLVGTFAVISLFGFSINTLTLFGLVLAIGIVVDDAIVVVENTQRHLEEEGLGAREAARRATAEVVGPVIATALVLMAVFIPIAFLPGITGQLYRQFALTIAVSVALSALNALTLTPALCALLLRPAGATRKRWLARTWDAGFLRLTNGYDRTVRRIVRRSALAVVALLLLSAAGYGLLRIVPTGFAPTEDQGYLLVNVQLPDAASVERTDAVVRQIEKILLETPGVETVVAIGGRSFITGVNGPNVASLFPRLTPWSKRKTRELQAGAILGRLRARLGSIQEASIVVFPPPPDPGHQLGRRVSVRAAERGRRLAPGARRDRAQDHGRGPPAAGAGRDLHGIPAGRAAARRAGGPRQGQGARHSAVGRLLEPADLPGLALRQRLQRVRARVPGAASGRAELPRLAQRRRAALCPEPARHERAARADGAAEHARHGEADHRARHDLPLQPVPDGGDRGRHRARGQLRSGHRGHAGRGAQCDAGGHVV